MSYRIPLRQRPSTAFSRRIRYFLSRLFGTRLQKSQKVYIVSANGHGFKRIILRDSYLASQIEENLVHFGASNQIPAFVARYENEVWVEFIEGTLVTQVDEDLVRKIAGLYANIYTRAPRQVATADSGFVERLYQDLRFLRQVGVLVEVAYTELDAAVEHLAPVAVWVGFDHIDPVIKNFVLAADDRRICAVDVESLLNNQLIGTGVAKALVCWMEPYRLVFFDELARTVVPDFRSSLSLIELSFLAMYAKMMFLEKKWKTGWKLTPRSK